MAKLGDFTVEAQNGSPVALADKLGKVLLIVNTASKCGFTPQYAGLEELYKTYGDRGFEILAFPCNQFGGQEPGSNAEVAEFCAVNYGLSFPVMAKIDVNGENAAPLFSWLKSEARGIFWSQKIKWNFTKFLIGRDGRVVARYAPATNPDKLASAIEGLL